MMLILPTFISYYEFIVLRTISLSLKNITEKVLNYHNLLFIYLGLIKIMEDLPKYVQFLWDDNI